ncbi:MAG TPA: MOSC N-terminal beta barrel domain-containing protein [Burkholderiales bacterium]|nr:MOSC N-terminal beta barrel domain-containing protein [Burkholderiales bacterium]
MRVSALYVYPVKGCRAVSVDEAALGPLGLEHDRRFAFVGPNGRAVTQRDQPLLATICPALDDGVLRLDFGGLGELTIHPDEFRNRVSVDVWGAPIPARSAPMDRASAYLGTPVALVRLDAGARRSFADAKPVLVATTGMLAALNLPGVGMERFRPNVVLEGAADWSSLKGETVVLERDKPCGRCEVTTIDQASGANRGPEPLRTLNERFAGNFGVYCRVARSGRLRSGETLTAA